MRVRFRVPDMHCPACVVRLESLEDRLPGIREIQASYHQQRLDVEFDEQRLRMETLIAEAQKLGYTLVAEVQA